MTIKHETASSIMITQGTKVKGAISGKYLGIVKGLTGNAATIRAPDGTILALPLVMIEPVPELVAHGQPRIWVGS